LPTNDATPGPVGADQGSFAALLGLIGSTGGFATVLFGDPSLRARAGADGYPLAIVTPKGWTEVDDYDPTSILRRTSFAITIVAKARDAAPPYDRLDQLARAIKLVVDGSDLGGQCLPELTRIGSGRFEPTSHHPEHSVELEGEFAAIIDPTTQLPATS
jgi:hypothetical protein